MDRELAESERRRRRGGKTPQHGVVPQWLVGLYWSQMAHHKSQRKNDAGNMLLDTTAGRHYFSARLITDTRKSYVTTIKILTL